MGEPLTYSDQELAAIKWGGLAGILGSLCLIAVFVFLAALVGLETLDVEEELQRYPEIRTTRVVENSMYLVAIALWAVHTAALFLALRRTSLAPALVGSVMMGLGLIVLATGAIPHTMTDPISALYHAPGATPETQAMSVVAWHVIQGIVDTLVITGLALTPIGMGFLGLAMLSHATYQSWFGWTSILFAVAGAASAVSIVMTPSDIAAIGVFAVIFFNIIVGWRTFRLPELAGPPK